jgi:hypothetical protein
VARPVARIAVLASLMLVAGLASVQATGDDRLKPEALASCWDCHRVVQGECPPLQTFATLVPASEAGALPGGPFDLPVQVQNAWCADFYAVRVNLNLTNAPSLGFVSGVPTVAQVVDAAIALDPQQAQREQRSQPMMVDIPAGETHLDVHLRPPAGLTGSDLALLVYPPGTDLDGAPPITRDEGAQGAEETYVLEGRAALTEKGYGRWTFFAQARLVPANGGGIVVPSPDQDVPFQLEVNARSDSADTRIGSVTGADPGHPVAKAATLPVTFQLVALAPPAEGERVSLSVDVWPHYFHNNNRPAEDDDENVTKVHPVDIPVVNEGGRTVVRSGAAPDTVVGTVVNGPTMATASEAVGYATAFLLVSSVGTGGMFGKASRRGLNHVFGSAKRRVAFHNFLSYGILLAAAVHATLFIIEAAYEWTLGLIWGGLAVLALVGLGVTGAIQVPLIRSWSYGAWRWTHYGMAVAAIVFTLVHVALDGVHFTDIQRALDWSDPLAPGAPT